MPEAYRLRHFRLKEHLNKTKISGARGVQPGEVADFSKNGPVFGVYALPS